MQGWLLHAARLTLPRAQAMRLDAQLGRLTRPAWQPVSALAHAEHAAACAGRAARMHQPQHPLACHCRGCHSPSLVFPSPALSPRSRGRRSRPSPAPAAAASRRRGPACPACPLRPPHLLQPAQEVGTFSPELDPCLGCTWSGAALLGSPMLPHSPRHAPLPAHALWRTPSLSTPADAAHAACMPRPAALQRCSPADRAPGTCAGLRAQQGGPAKFTPGQSTQVGALHPALAHTCQPQHA